MNYIIAKKTKVENKIKSIIKRLFKKKKGNIFEKKINIFLRI